MLVESAVIHFSRICLLAVQEINGVWLSLSLDGQNRPKRLPYSIIVVKYPSVKYYLKHKPNNVDLNGSTSDSDGTEAKKETFKKGRK